jgi:hypothetical protein
MNVLAERTERPVAALLLSDAAPDDPGWLEPMVRSLLDNGCEYFVCFGRTSEALHDQIDELVVAHAATGDRTVVTTWHDAETPTDVAAFFFDIAAPRQGSLLVAALEPRDADFASALVRQATA